MFQEKVRLALSNRYVYGARADFEVQNQLSLQGDVAEWFKAHAWKACWAQALAGSNPVVSAI
tara:strand:- start:2365 stop:2550 length:186 start_codon:yes stop_codon:yes gene_type:complete